METKAQIDAWTLWRQFWRTLFCSLENSKWSPKVPPETFSRRATHRFPHLFPFSNNVPKCHVLVVLLWKKDTRYKKYFTFINFGFLSSTWRHFAALLENGNKGANRWLVLLETILVDIFFLTPELKMSPKVSSETLSRGANHRVPPLFPFSNETHCRKSDANFWTTWRQRF